jgi:hypothetical protein
MKKQFVTIGIIALLLTTWLTGCNSTEQTNEQEQTSEEKIIGEWIDTTYYNQSYIPPQMIYNFYSNGTYCRHAINITESWCSDYVFTEEQLILNAGSGDKEIYYYIFSNDTQRIVLTDSVDYLWFHVLHRR